jgi:hypothetical protein
MITTHRLVAAFSRTRLTALVVIATLLAALIATMFTPTNAYAATPAPTGLRAATQTTTSVTLRWAAVSGAPKYELEYSDSATFANPRYRALDATTGRISGLGWGVPHYFKVRVVADDGAALSAYSAALKVSPQRAAARPQPAKAAAVQAAPLRIGSYNVRCSSCYEGKANEGTWEQRRSAVVATIKGQDLDALGVQEASQGRLKDSSGASLSYTQFEDLATRLGSPWKLVNPKRYNCVKDTTPTNCVYQYQGASQGTKLLYNSDRVELLSNGSKKLFETDATETHYVAWAIMRQINTGQEFIMSDTHTIPSATNYDVRKKQTEEALAEIKAHNPEKLPMIAVGDWNSGRFDKPSNAPRDVYTNAGFVDPLGATAGTTKTAPGATVEKRIDTWLNSSNGDWLRKPPSHPDWINGTYIDYIMTTPMRVSEWETVTNVDSNGNLIGQIPSDHNLIRATVWLPQ